MARDRGAARPRRRVDRGRCPGALSSAQRGAVARADEMLVGAAKEVSAGARPIARAVASSRRSRSRRSAGRRFWVSSGAHATVGVVRTVVVRSRSRSDRHDGGRRAMCLLADQRPASEGAAVDSRSRAFRDGYGRRRCADMSRLPDPWRRRTLADCQARPPEFVLGVREGCLGPRLFGIPWALRR